MPSGRRAGSEVFWREWGDGQAEMLMIHCTLAHSGALAGLVLELDRSAVAFDMPGHGKSGPHDSGIDLHLETTKIAADFLGETPVDVVGHSFGATVALRLALENPNAVRRLVLIEPVLFAAARGTPHFDHHAETTQPFVQAMIAGDTAQAAKLFTEMWGAGVAWEHKRKDQRASLAEQILLVPEQNAAIFEDNAGMLSPERLEALECPVLFIKGAGTEPIIGAVEDALRTRIPTTQAATIEGAGHMVPITHPVETARVIRAFLV